MTDSTDPRLEAVAKAWRESQVLGVSSTAARQILAAADAADEAAGVRRVTAQELQGVREKERRRIAEAIEAARKGRTCNQSCRGTGWCSGMDVGFIASRDIAAADSPVGGVS